MIYRKISFKQIIQNCWKTYIRITIEVILSEIKIIIGFVIEVWVKIIDIFIKYFLFSH